MSDGTSISPNLVKRYPAEKEEEREDKRRRWQTRGGDPKKSEETKKEREREREQELLFTFDPFFVPREIAFLIQSV